MGFWNKKPDSRGGKHWQTPLWSKGPRPEGGRKKFLIPYDTWNNTFAWGKRPPSAVEQRQLNSRVESTNPGVGRGLPVGKDLVAPQSQRALGQWLPFSRLVWPGGRAIQVVKWPNPVVVPQPYGFGLAPTNPTALDIPRYNWNNVEDDAILKQAEQRVLSRLKPLNRAVGK